MIGEHKRIIRKPKKNPIVECNKIQQKFYLELFSNFMQVAKPQHSGYIEYNSKVMFGALYYGVTDYISRNFRKSFKERLGLK